jgi:RND family efflux transporter MFP subunit
LDHHSHTSFLYIVPHQRFVEEHDVKKGRWSAGFAITVLATVISINVWPGNEADSNTDVRKTASVNLGALSETITATGVIRPVTGAEVNVGSRISGTVVSLPVEVGDRVAVGQLLAELDRTALQAEADEARADVDLSNPRVELAKSILARREKLATKGLASDEDLEIARRDLAVARAELQANRARLRSAEIELDYTRITAPIDGVVAEVSTREGETVAAAFAAPNFVTIIDLERLEVLAYVDETDIGRVVVGQFASFTVDTFPDTEFTARVTAIQPRAELQGSVVNYLARLEFKRSEDFTLRPEMTAHVRIVVDEREQVLTAPRATIKRNTGRQYVVVQRGGEWLEQDVRTGWRSDTAVEFLSGVREGDVLELNPR